MRVRGKESERREKILMLRETNTRQNTSEQEYDGQKEINSNWE